MVYSHTRSHYPETWPCSRIGYSSHLGTGVDPFSVQCEVSDWSMANSAGGNLPGEGSEPVPISVYVKKLLSLFEPFSASVTFDLFSTLSTLQWLWRSCPVRIGLNEQGPPLTFFLPCDVLFDRLSSVHVVRDFLSIVFSFCFISHSWRVRKYDEYLCCLSNG